MKLFNSNSQFLYQAPGKLIIDVGESGGFRFEVQIERAGSDGIDNMKVFCFDLMLGQLWADREPSPRLIVHDSRLFDPVDERQRALALELAWRESERRNFQYICTLNSDSVPWKELPEGFEFDKYLRLRLSDKTPADSLLGFRF